MSDIFREVDEALEREKMAKIWATHGTLIVACVLTLILATAGWTGFNSWQTWKNERATNALLLALEGQTQEEVQTALTSFLETAGGGAEEAAQFHIAALKVKENDFKGARALYAALKDSAGSPKTKGLAAIFYTRTALLEQTPPDYAALISALTPAAKDLRSPFYPLAALELSVLYGEGLKEYEAALDTLKRLPPTIPANIKEKADALTHLYTQELAANVKATVEPTKSP